MFKRSIEKIRRTSELLENVVYPQLAMTNGSL
jgi:hypothetical protein